MLSNSLLADTVFLVAPRCDPYVIVDVQVASPSQPASSQSQYVKQGTRAYYFITGTGADDLSRERCREGLYVIIVPL